MWEIAPIVGYSDLLPISLAVRSEGQVFDFFVKRSITPRSCIFLDLYHYFFIPPIGTDTTFIQ